MILRGRRVTERTGKRGFLPHQRSQGIPSEKRVSISFSTKSWFWVNYNDLTLTGIMWLDCGNHPQMAARFRWVKYYNLPRWLEDSNRRPNLCFENLDMKHMGQSPRFFHMGIPESSDTLMASWFSQGHWWVKVPSVPVCPTKSCSPKRSCFADVSSMGAERKRHSEEFGSRWQSLSTSIGWNFNDSRYFVIKTMGSHYVSNIWNQTFGSTFPTHPALAPYGTSVWSSACSNASARSLSPKETMGLCQLIPKPEFHACEILPTPSEMKKISNFIDTCSLIFMF